MKIFAVKSSALLLRKMRRKNGAVKTSELRSSVAKEDKEKNGLGQKLKIDIDQRLHRDGGVQGNRDKLIFFAVKNS